MGSVSLFSVVICGRGVWRFVVTGRGGQTMVAVKGRN